MTEQERISLRLQIMMAAIHTFELVESEEDLIEKANVIFNWVIEKENKKGEHHD